MENEFKNNPDIEVGKEVPVFTPNSKTHKQRIIDVAAYGINLPTRYVKAVQVGKTNKDGTPVKREQEAIEDIETHTGIQVVFVDYENYKLDK